MPIEKQVVSLEIAQRLKALNVEQNTSYFVWILYAGEWVVGNRYFPLPYTDACAAYTVAELIELLGDKFGVIALSPRIGRAAMSHLVGEGGVTAEAPTMADALGLLLEKTLNA